MTDFAALVGEAAVQRDDDGLYHVGPPGGLQIPFDSPLFTTRCGLTAYDGPWRPADMFAGNVWCIACLQQAGLA